LLTTVTIHETTQRNNISQLLERGAVLKHRAARPSRHKLFCRKHLTGLRTSSWTLFLCFCMHENFAWFQG
jgi:hypothetical protein